MVRTFDTKYGAWLAGYYDDFTGARAIANDFNQPSSNSITYNSSDSHHGNTLNGEATLNPRFRWAYVDRERSSGSNFFSATTNKYLKNAGIFEWLSIDLIRNQPSTWAGSSQQQYPDGRANANKSRFSKDAGEAYQMFTNGYKTGDFYVVPVGENDFSFGRDTFEAYDATNYGNEIAGKPTTENAAFMQAATLAGAWMGEDVGDFSSANPSELFSTVKSLSGQPFLCIQSYRSATSDGKPTIYYEGSLNSILDNDVFSARFAIRSFGKSNSGSGIVTPTVRFQVGFPEPSSNLTNGRRINDDGLEGTAEIDYTLNFSSNTLVSSYDLYGDDTDYTNSDAWIDIDFLINYTAGTYKVFINGTEDTSTTFNLAGNLTASQMHGWQLTQNGTSGTDFVQYLMLDRVGLLHHLSDSLAHDSNETPLVSMEMNLNSNGVSNGSVVLQDDPQYESNTQTFGTLATSYYNKLTKIVKDTQDWQVLLYGNENESKRDRPIFRGLISNFDIKQIRNERALTLNFNEPSTFLDTQIPLWEVGQKSVKDDSDSTSYWLYDAEGFKHIMNFGSTKLKMLSNKVGFDIDDVYTERSDQRLKLGSGHPIQMYNNEDDFGPNSAEIYYEGIRIKATYNISGNVVFETHENHGLSSGDSITIAHDANYNGTYTLQSGTGTNKLYTTATYVPETPKILYAGKFLCRHYLRANDPKYISRERMETVDFRYPNSAAEQNPFVNIVVDANPSLKAGDHISIDEQTVYSGASMEVVDVSGPYRNVFQSTWDISGGDYDHENDERQYYVIHTNYPAEDDAGTTGQYLFESTFTATTANSGTGTQRSTISNIPSSEAAKIRAGHHVFGTFTRDNNKPYLVTSVDTSANTLTFENYSTATGSQTINVRGDNFLVGNTRLRYAKAATGIIKHNSFESRPQHKALHAKWMRDLPHSLWFQFHFGIISKNPKAIGTTAADANSSSTQIEITEEFYDQLNTNNFNHGIAEITQSGETSKIIYKSLASTSTLSGSRFFMMGVKFLNKTFTAGATIKIARISNDYKHIWLLWSDMRNNGHADADGSLRKSTFGLKYPTPDNYNISLFFTDTVDNRGKQEQFTDLKIGDDVDLWQVDSTVDNSTSVPFSQPVDWANTLTITTFPSGTDSVQDSGGNIQITKPSHGLAVNDYVYIWGTNKTSVNEKVYQVTAVNGNDVTFDGSFVSGLSGSQTHSSASNTQFSVVPITGSYADVETKYHNWHNKAGAFLVIDSSKFFNLNTAANQGAIGQDAGGSTYLEDYVATIRGYPALIDNYWQEVITSGKNISSLFGSHPNADKLIHDTTFLTNSLNPFHTAIKVNDVSEFSNSGMGRIQVTKSGSGTRAEDKIEYYFLWGNKLATKLTGFATGLSSTSTHVIITDTQQNKFNTVKENMLVESLASGKSYKVTSVNSGSNQITIDRVSVDDNVLASGADWTVGTGYRIPVQLSDAFLISPTQVTLSTELEFEVDEDDATRASGSIKFNTNPAGSSSSTDLSNNSTDGATVTIASFKDTLDVRTYIFRTGISIGSPTHITGSRVFTPGGLNNYVFVDDISGFDSSVSEGSPGTVIMLGKGTGDNHVLKPYILEYYLINTTSKRVYLRACSDANAGSFASNNYFEDDGSPVFFRPVANTSLGAGGNQVFHPREDPTHTGMIMVKRESSIAATVADLKAAIDSPEGNNEGIAADNIQAKVASADNTKLLLVQNGRGIEGNRPILVTRYGSQADFTTIIGLDGGEEALSRIQIDNKGTLPAELMRLYNIHLSSSDASNPSINIFENSAAVSSSLSSEFALRLMMYLEGDVENENSGTFYDHDKFRVLWNAASMNTWLPPTNINTPIDINNVPVTVDMTYDGTLANEDTFGSMLDSRGKTLGSIMQNLQKTSGFGKNNNYLPFTKTVGRDGRVDFRPRYNSGLSLDRTNLKESNISGGVVSKVKNVRVYYDDSKAFVDFPSTNLQDTTKWKVVEYPQIKNSLEALKVAKREYNAVKESPLQIRAKPILEGDVERIMVDSGRYGYIADPCRATQSHNTLGVGNAFYWTGLGTGGCLFPGQVNAMDGNLGAVSDRRNRVGVSNNAGSADVTYTNNFFWYGANSLSYALQIVHVPNKTPLVSTTTGNDLRVFISLKNGQSGSDADNAEFTIFLVDYVFDSNGAVSSVSSVSSKDVEGSGFYEIDVPSSYGAVANAKFVVSVNAEYLQSLVRHRCGSSNTLKNAHVLEDGSSTTALSSITTGNTNSIFPLGGRNYSNLASPCGAIDERTSWYAPRIHVVRDVSFWPATHVSYTDHGLDLSNETLTIKRVSWSFNAEQQETCDLTLERDESLLAQNVMSYLFPTFDYTEPTISIVEANTVPPSFAEEVGSGTQTLESNDWNEQNPTDSGNSEGEGLNDNSGDNYNDYRQGQATINQIGSNAWATFSGFGALTQDMMGSRGQFRVLGQKRPTTVSTSMRNLDADITLEPVEGAGSKGAEGYIFPAGASPGGESGYLAKTVFETEFIVPKDIVSDQIELHGDISHGVADQVSSGNGQLVTSLYNHTTGVTTSHTLNIGLGTDNETMYLFPRQRVAGLNTVGTRFTLSVTRNPNSTSENGAFTSVVLHNVNLALDRANNVSADRVSAFTPFE